MTDYKPDKKDIKKGNAKYKRDKKNEKKQMKKFVKDRDDVHERTLDPYLPERAHWLDRKTYDRQRPFTARDHYAAQPAVILRRNSKTAEVDKNWSLSPASTRGPSGSSIKQKHEWKTFEPICDIAEVDDWWIVRAEMPGVSKDGLSVEVQGDVLYLKGKKDKKDKNVSVQTGDRVSWLTRERGNGKFKREIQLPEKIDEPHRVEALYKFGILEVLIPKSTTNEKKYTTTGNGKRIPIN